MAIAGELLELAGHLSKPTAMGQEQAWLRRSVSTAYYAVFQLLVQQASQRWTGSPASRLALQRTFQHAQMKEVCKAILNGSWRGWSSPQLTAPTELRDLAGGFVGLQEARHQADYNNGKSWTRTEVSAKFNDAEMAFQNWMKIAGSAVAEEFLLALMIGKKRE